MWQRVLMAVLVLLALGYTIWSFMTLRARQRLLDACAARGLWVRWAERHRARLLTPGCGNCPAATPRTPRTR